MQTFHILEYHDGWGYEIAGQASKTYASREEAEAAARAEAERLEAEAARPGPDPDNQADLDEGLRESFPASDPVAVTQAGHGAPDDDDTPSRH